MGERKLAGHLNGPRIKEGMKVENLPIKRLRQRLFNWKSHILFGQDYTFTEDVIHVPKHIEQLEGFTNWESFGELWDILWVGFDPRTFQWVPGRHNSPVRQLIEPLVIVQKDERSERMMVNAKERQIINALDVPIKKEHLTETDEDRAIAESLTGKVIVDEPDKDKAIRAIEQNIELLLQQLAEIKK